MKLLKRIFFYNFLFLGLTFGITLSAVANEFEASKILAEKGNAQAQYKLAIMYDKGEGVRQNQTQATDWYRKAANQGYAQAQYNLGGMYSSGDGIRQSYTQAADWYQKAANQGHVSAQYNLAILYNKGEGVRQNQTQAKEWFGKVCDNGRQDGCDGYRKLKQLGY